ncbi:FAR1 DNA binding domain-containing protein [Artemisia annua]|uniref:FAR1 DNA binding domain-containing protein n=1 Tax=Artemisia annua TaxID=35608 RepID=A0A2U1PJF7_ARTAN|nr:FAR1 DNA binding domain-containing protein [Artemisia annua]
MYGKYAEAGGFKIKKAGQRLTKSGIVQLKYIMCNKEGAPRHINIDTLDAKHSDKQKRNTTMHVTGCKARIRLELDIVSRKYKLVQFIAEHNHLLIPKEYKHFTKKQRRMTHGEKMFVVKAAKNKIGPTRAHNLLTSIKDILPDTVFYADTYYRDINVIPKQYILRRWTRDIIPPDLRRKRKRYGEKCKFEKQTNEATCVVDDCLFRLSNNVEKMGAFVEKMKTLKTEVEAEVPNPPSMGDVIAEYFAIFKQRTKQLTIQQGQATKEILQK